jgi:hypothetical protein
MEQKERGMIDIPIGKALVAVEAEKAECDGCILTKVTEAVCWNFPCNFSERKDGKNVIFKLVDYPAKEQTCSGN